MLIDNPYLVAERTYLNLNPKSYFRNCNMPRYVYFCNSALIMFSTFIPYLLQSIWNLFQTYPRGQNFDNSIRRFDVSCGCTFCHRIDWSFSKITRFIGIEIYLCNFCMTNIRCPGDCAHTFKFLPFRWLIRIQNSDNFLMIDINI